MYSLFFCKCKKYYSYFACMHGHGHGSEWTSQIYCLLAFPPCKRISPPTVNYIYLLKKCSQIYILCLLLVTSQQEWLLTLKGEKNIGQLKNDEQCEHARQQQQQQQARFHVNASDDNEIICIAGSAPWSAHKQNCVFFNLYGSATLQSAIECV